MMDFSPPPRRAAQDSLLPMINVVFLLLVFFLISARMTPPEPFPVTPPEAQAQEEAQGLFTLHVAADGLAGYREAMGEAALEALAAARGAHCAAVDCVAEPPRLLLRADAALPGQALARMLPRLAAMGFARVDLLALEAP
jgi:biopolymer transport protein ExbD